MGAIAISAKEAEQIEKLRKELKIPTKSGVLRAALNVLQAKTDEERLRREIAQSVLRCSKGDRRENAEIFPGSIAGDDDEA